jgi:hypothetical protein
MLNFYFSGLRTCWTRHTVGICTMLGGVSNLFAQDTHYWSQQAGTQAMLLGGALSAGAYDNSAIYYNPAALAFVTSTHLSVNANAYKYESLNLKNGGGDSIDLVSRRISLYPQMVGNMLTHKPESKLKAAFAVINRQQANWDMNANTPLGTQRDILPQHAGTEDFIGTLNYQNLLNEIWVGAGVGYQLHPNLSVGWSSFLSYRNQRYYNTISTRTMFYDGQNMFISAYGSNTELRANNLKNINKLALHSQYKNWRFGLVSTLPSINIAGWSRVKREISFQNLPNNVNGVLYDQDKNLPTNQKYPFSLSAGASVQIKAVGLNLAAEYFGRIGLYEMIQSEAKNVFFPSTVSQSPRDLLSFYSFADPVLNIGFGMDWDVNERLSFLLGLRTDYSYSNRPPREFDPSKMSLIASPNFDLYHSSLGLSWKRKASLFTVGMNYSFAYKQRVKSFINFAQPNYDQFLIGESRSISSITSNAFTLLIGYTYYFALQ